MAEGHGGVTRRRQLLLPFPAGYPGHSSSLKKQTSQSILASRTPSGSRPISAPTGRLPRWPRCKARQLELFWFSS